jgi:tRNA(fMet)-specific endonuclease VapC
VARLILDTGVLVRGARGQLDASAIGDQDDVAVPAVVIAEYLTGVLLDGDPGRRATQRGFLEQVLDVTPVEDYTPAVARHHAALLAHVRTTGQPRGAHDLIIAATARATGRLLLTTDARARFDELPDLQARVLPEPRAE